MSYNYSVYVCAWVLQSRLTKKVVYEKSLVNWDSSPPKCTNTTRSSLLFKSLMTSWCVRKGSKETICIPRCSAHPLSAPFDCSILLKSCEPDPKKWVMCCCSWFCFFFSFILGIWCFTVSESITYGKWQAWYGSLILFSDSCIITKWLQVLMGSVVKAKHVFSCCFSVL